MKLIYASPENFTPMLLVMLETFRRSGPNIVEMIVQPTITLFPVNKKHTCIGPLTRSKGAVKQLVFIEQEKYLYGTSSLVEVDNVHWTLREVLLSKRPRSIRITKSSIWTKNLVPYGQEVNFLMEEYMQFL